MVSLYLDLSRAQRQFYRQHIPLSALPINRSAIDPMTSRSSSHFICCPITNCVKALFGECSEMPGGLIKFASLALVLVLSRHSPYPASSLPLNVCSFLFLLRRLDVRILLEPTHSFVRVRSLALRCTELKLATKLAKRVTWTDGGTDGRATPSPPPKPLRDGRAILRCREFHV